jgi:hypothetical protein
MLEISTVDAAANKRSEFYTYLGPRWVTMAVVRKLQSGFEYGVAACVDEERISIALFFRIKNDATVFLTM